MDFRKWIVIVGTGASMAVAAVAGTAFAQSAPAVTPTPNQQTQANYQNFFLDRLASLLGTTRDKLNSAVTQARNDTVDQAVKDGRLTQDQANQIKSTQSTGGFGPGFGFGRGHGDGFGQAGGRNLDVIAQALGMSTQDLVTQLQSGKTLAQLAAGKEQAVKDAVVAAEKAELDQAVQSGRITQDQENQRLDQIRNSTDLNQLLHSGGRGGPGAGARPTSGPGATS